MNIKFIICIWLINNNNYYIINITNIKLLKMEKTWFVPTLALGSLLSVSSANANDMNFSLAKDFTSSNVTKVLNTKKENSTKNKHIDRSNHSEYRKVGDDARIIAPLLAWALTESFYGKGNDINSELISSLITSQLLIEWIKGAAWDSNLNWRPDGTSKWILSWHAAAYWSALSTTEKLIGLSNYTEDGKTILKYSARTAAIALAWSRVDAKRHKNRQAIGWLAVWYMGDKIVKNDWMKKNLKDVSFWLSEEGNLWLQYQKNW